MASPTPAELQAMRALAEKATTAAPGPWHYVPWHIAEGPSQVRTAAYLLCELPGDDAAAFIAAAHPQRVIEIIDALVSARAALKTEREACAQVADAWAERHLHDEPDESIAHRAEQISAAGFIAARIRARPAHYEDEEEGLCANLRAVPSSGSVYCPNCGMHWDSLAKFRAHLGGQARKEGL